MKYDHRILLCCVVAWFCWAYVECHANLLDAGANSYKVGNSTDIGKPENDIKHATNIHEDLSVKSYPGVHLNDTGDDYALKKCDCGPNSTSCIFQNGVKQCTCKEGYKVINEWCKDPFEECEEKCGVDLRSVTCQIEKNETLCLCEKGKQFDYRLKICRIDNCYEKCGVLTPGEIWDEVKCKGHPFGRVDCICLHDNKTFDPDTRRCRECVCGDQSFGCKFEKGEKKCECYGRYGQKDGVCIDCECGDDSVGCVFEKDEKKCECHWDFANRNGKCIKCNCGDRSSSCKFEKHEKICECDSIYAQKDGVCTVCNCGANSIGCKFENGEKKCECYKTYSQMDGVCTACDCGSFATGCSFHGDHKTCDCFSNYVQKGDQCVGKETETDSKAVYAALILGTCLAIVLIILFIVLYKMNRMKKNLI